MKMKKHCFLLIQKIFYLKSLNLKKNINKDYYTQPYNKPPKIISSILNQKTLINKVVNFRVILNIGIIFRVINQNNLELLEGDVINILSFYGLYWRNS